ncbi:prolyl 4-hydroxylase 1-like [Neltuma alba]|uniref:prolyl 4-hydroxylase 1-like n=1 Tax=Neltuma alba TaxID=207710 RepID=UPI0010A47E20|nr:prolyl 4-hydroxylase 1-like [Prosopis alba]
MKFIFGILSFVTVGLIIGSVSQLAFYDNWKTHMTFHRHIVVINIEMFVLPCIPSLKNDKEAEILRPGYVKPEVLSWSPRIILLRNFLSMEECEYLKALGYPHLQNSRVIDDKTGKGVDTKRRTSSGMFLSSKDRKHPMVQAIERRISIYAQVPVENGEPMQILRYEKNQYYELHLDYFSDTYDLKNNGQRIATMLMYLSDNVEGGETYFPKGGSDECNCGGKIVKGLSVKPVKGNAVLFWSMGLSGQ